MLLLLAASLLGVVHWLHSPGVHRLGNRVYVNLQETCLVYAPISNAFLENSTLSWQQRLDLSREKTLDALPYRSVSSSLGENALAVRVEGLEPPARQFTQRTGGLYFPEGKLGDPAPLAELLVSTAWREDTATWVLFVLPDSGLLVLGIPGQTPRIALCGFEGQAEARAFLESPYGQYLLERTLP